VLWRKRHKKSSDRRPKFGVMNDNGKRYALAALKERRASIDGEIKACELHGKGASASQGPQRAMSDRRSKSADDPRAISFPARSEANKRADLTYDALAQRLRVHGFAETKASIANKLARATLAAHFYLASLAAIGKESVGLQEI
jgi:hypothetical protein